MFKWRKSNRVDHTNVEQIPWHSCRCSMQAEEKSSLVSTQNQDWVLALDTEEKSSSVSTQKDQL